MKKFLDKLKTFLLTFLTCIFSLAVLIYSGVAIAEPDIRTPMIVASVVFLIPDIFLIRKLIKTHRERKTKVIFEHETKSVPQTISKTETKPQSPQIENTIQLEQKKITTIEYPVRIFADTYSFKGMAIKSSIYPPRDNFFIYNNNELLFFNAMVDQFVYNKLVPQNVTLTRMGGNDFEVDYRYKNGGCYVGRINLSFEPKFAVMKIGGVKAIKIFTSKDEAEEYISDKENYFIEERKHPFHMQYSIGMTKIESITTYNVQDCIDTIFRWIRYINYCKRN